MNERKILICDDESFIEENLSCKLEAIGVAQQGFIVDFSRGRFRSAIDSLENRLASAREKKNPGFPSNDNASIIDQASILIIDYDLLKMDPTLTGERAAYLARCFSRCGVIVALNQFPPYMVENFDLTLRGHPESFADLNIPSDSIGNRGLWQEPWNGFRPWSWPLLPLAFEKFERRWKSLLDKLDQPIFEYLGLDKAKSLSLPRSLIEYISRSGDPKKTSFRDFVQNSGNGLKRKDVPLADEAVARIAAARLHNWLENMILPGQDILVDAPHLISRYPSLVRGDMNDLAVLDRATRFVGLDILDAVIAQFQMQAEDWISRSVWFWGDVSNCEAIKEISDPWSLAKPDSVFCEDISRFAPQDKARGFVADLESPFIHRFVSYMDGIEYTPQVRFSL
jgi:hypothetical protein